MSIYIWFNKAQAGSSTSIFRCLEHSCLVMAYAQTGLIALNSNSPTRRLMEDHLDHLDHLQLSRLRVLICHGRKYA